MKKNLRLKRKSSRRLIIALLLLAVICSLICIFTSKLQTHSELFKHSNAVLQNLYTVDADAIINKPSNEEYAVLCAQYGKNMSADAVEKLMQNRTHVRISTSVRNANGIARFVKAVYEREGDGDQYKYIVTVALTVNGEEFEIYPTGKIRINSNGIVIYFTETHRIDQLIDEMFE